MEIVGSGLGTGTFLWAILTCSLSSDLLLLKMPVASILCPVPLNSSFNKNKHIIYLFALWRGQTYSMCLYGGQGQFTGAGSLLSCGSNSTCQV